MLSSLEVALFTVIPISEIERPESFSQPADDPTVAIESRVASVDPRSDVTVIKPVTFTVLERASSMSTKADWVTLRWESTLLTATLRRSTVTLCVRPSAVADPLPFAVTARSPFTFRVPLPVSDEVADVVT